MKNDGAVAREAGTSEDVIFRHYHRLPVAGSLRRWLALRPAKDGDSKVTPFNEAAVVSEGLAVS